MTETTTILLVDDEPQIARWLNPSLRAAGYAVDNAETGTAALARAAAGPCELILLDLGLPDMDGKDVIARVREWSEMPIIVLSARDQEAEKVTALDLGADDFVNKPVGIDELLARIRASLRNRARRATQAPVFRSGDLEINLAARRVKVEGEEMRLTPREYDLLKALARHAGMVLTHAQIIALVWGPDASVEAQHVRVLMAQLRNKIEADPSNPRLLLTETGVGYRLRSDDDG
ncbi:response regulator transcription factor [Phenylobacterium sp.]|uniref:response regulator n=1 Tax=Phenylobacterium sp. TaxID=1871053 RepID=UPI0025F97788|nr:response regulator transcription factor [Phenylobacterium sp.]